MAATVVYLYGMSGPLSGSAQVTLDGEVMSTLNLSVRFDHSDVLDDLLNTAESMECLFIPVIHAVQP